MKMKAKVSWLDHKFSIILGFTCVGLLILMEILKLNPSWVERYYSQTFYPAFSYFSIVLFSWLPFSVGDIFYATVSLYAIFLLVKLIRSCFQKYWSDVKRYAIHMTLLLLVLYTFFQLNWGLNYHRTSLVEKLDLPVKELVATDYKDALLRYIDSANVLRGKLHVEDHMKFGVKKDIVQFVKEDTLFNSFLSKSQVHAKSPLSSDLVSYFAVSGYFNPFTQECQVNQNVPIHTIPFTYVHELCHQMGIGFEDECNFIAFVKLRSHKNMWYQYAAYYQAIQSLLSTTRRDDEEYKKFVERLSPAVKADFKAEYDFWKGYEGPVDRLSSWFYNAYLKHNNQPEGLKRYNMMAKLTVAWDKKQIQEKQ